MHTTDNPDCIHGPLDPSQALLNPVDFAQAFINMPMSSDLRRIVVPIVLQAKAPLDGQVQRQLVQTRGKVDEEQQDEQCSDG